MSKPLKFAFLSKKYPSAPDFSSSCFMLQMKLMREALEVFAEGKELLRRLGPEPKVPESGDTHPFVRTASARVTLMLCKFIDIATARQTECDDLYCSATDPLLLTVESEAVDRAVVLDWMTGRSREECADAIFKLLVLGTEQRRIIVAREKYQLAQNAQLEVSAYREHQRNEEVDEAFEQAIQLQEEVARLQNVATNAEEKARQAEKNLESLSARINSMAMDIRKECKSKKKERKIADPIDRLESSVAMLKQHLTKETTQSVEVPKDEERTEPALQMENDDLKQQLSTLRKLYDEEKLLVGQQSEELAKLRAAAKQAKKSEKKSKKH